MESDGTMETIAFDKRSVLRDLDMVVIPVTDYAQNCTLIWDTRTHKGAVIDPGGAVDEIVQAIRDNHVDVEKLLITHGHFDHAAAATELQEILKVPIEGPHMAEREILAELDKQAAGYNAVARPVYPDRWYEDGDTATIAGQPFTVRHCPGHTPGGVVYINEQHKYAFFGDILMGGLIGPTDGIPGADHALLIKSIKEKLLVLDDDVTFFCGHTPPSTIGRERRTNPFIQ
jgi:hydroxyacylglutathione hydrolase